MSEDPTGGRSSGSFVRGMTLGALIGAALAGSSLWSRRRRARRNAQGRQAGDPAIPGPGPAASTTAAAGTVPPAVAEAALAAGDEDVTGRGG